MTATTDSTPEVAAGRGQDQLPERARVVIVGGGVIGVSIAYHLAKLGWSDVVLLERRQLTSGTTWHAAGLITGAGLATETLIWMTRYTRELCATLESETGQATGFRPIGHLHLATTPQRLETLRREAAFARGHGVDDQELSAAEFGRLWPAAKTDDVLAAFYVPDEGRVNPADLTMAYAKGARMGGVRIVEHIAVTGITSARGRVTGVVTERGPIAAEYVVNAAGMWGREVGAMAGVSVPLQAAEHYYLIQRRRRQMPPHRVFEDQQIGAIEPLDRLTGAPSHLSRRQRASVNGAYSGRCTSSSSAPAGTWAAASSRGSLRRGTSSHSRPVSRPSFLTDFPTPESWRAIGSTMHRSAKPSKA